MNYNPQTELWISSKGYLQKYMEIAFAALKQEPDNYKIMAKGFACENAEALLSKLRYTFTNYNFEINNLKAFNKRGEVVPEFHVMLTKKRFSSAY